MEPTEEETTINDINHWKCIKCKISHPQHHNYCYHCGTEKQISSPLLSCMSYNDLVFNISDIDI